MCVRLLICGSFWFGCRNVRICFFSRAKIPPRDKIIPKACGRASGGRQCSHVSAARRLCAKNADGVSRSTTRLLAARFARSNIRFSRVDSFAFFIQPSFLFPPLPTLPLCLSIILFFSSVPLLEISSILVAHYASVCFPVFSSPVLHRLSARRKCTNMPLMTRTFINVSQIYD